MAEAYARITFLFFAFNMFAQAANGILVGSGDATTPMLIGLVQVPVAIFFEWALAFGNFGFPAARCRGHRLWRPRSGGVFSFCDGAFVLQRSQPRPFARRASSSRDSAMLARIMKTSWQPALQMIARSAMIMVFMFLAGRIGSHVQAAYTIGLRIEMIAVMIAFPDRQRLRHAGRSEPGRRRSRPRMASSVRCSGRRSPRFCGPGAVLLYVSSEMPRSQYLQADPAVATRRERVPALRVVHTRILGRSTSSPFARCRRRGTWSHPWLISLALAQSDLGAPLALCICPSRPEYGASGMWIANAAYSDREHRGS